MTTAHDTSPAVIVGIHEHADARSAFVHALAVALRARGEIEVVDVRRHREDDELLSIRDVLEAWGALPPGSQRSDVEKLGIRVKKIVKEGSGEREIARRLERHEHDLLVIATQDREGLAGLFGQDLAAHLAQTHRQTTLYVPSECRPFINGDTGVATIRKVLVPVAADPASEATLLLLKRLLAWLGCDAPEVIGVHVGDVFPVVDAARTEGLQWSTRLVAPNGESMPRHLARLAREFGADLIALSTNGRDSLTQRVLGSITENLLKRTPCPVLSVAVR